MSQTRESFSSRVERVDRVEPFYMLLSLLGVSEFGRFKRLLYSKTPSNESEKMMCGVLQPLEPQAEESVVDDVSRVRPVKKVAFRQLGCCGSDCGSGRELVAPDKISAGYGLCNTLSADRLQDGLFGGSLASQKVEVERFRFCNEFVDGVIDLLSRIKTSAMRPDSVEDALDVPRYSLEAFVEMAKRPFREGASFAAEEPLGELPVLSGVDGAESHELRALVERALGRDEHGVHHVFPRAGEDEMLDVIP